MNVSACPQIPRIRSKTRGSGGLRAPALRNDNGVHQPAVTADNESIPARDLRYHRIDRLVPLAHSTGPPPAPTMPTRPLRLQPELSPGGNRTIHGNDRITHRLPTPLELGG